MNYLLVFDDSDGARAALHRLRRAARPGDMLHVLATVHLPASTPEDVSAGLIWRHVCRAEVRLHHAREIAGNVTPAGIPVRYARVQGHHLAATIAQCAATITANVILLPEARTPLRRFVFRTRFLPTLTRLAPCVVEVIGQFSPASADVPPLVFVPRDIRRGA